MTTYDVRPGHDGPGTHAFIIGVGEYPYLEGGVQESDRNWGLKQLPGAAISAANFLDWLRLRFHNPAAPLATIEHLITGPKGVALGSAVPTMAAIMDAFDSWFDRVSRSSDNITLFYFAGHGVLKGTETGLLASDFAKPRSRNLVRNVVHVEGTVQGMLSCRANKQCFIIDACRTMEEPLVGAMTIPGQALATALESDVRPIPQAVLFASGLNQAAYQNIVDASPFTKGLIQSLEGMGADDVGGGYSPGECAVDTASLQRGIEASMHLYRRGRPFIPPYQPTPGGGGSFVLHYPEEQIQVPLIVGCEPIDLNKDATLEIRQNGDPIRTRPPERGDLEHLVCPDAYEVRALLKDRKAQRTVLVTPPYREGRLKDFQPL
jgi:hypothetical protein